MVGRGRRGGAWPRVDTQISRHKYTNLEKRRGVATSGYRMGNKWVEKSQEEEGRGHEWIEKSREEEGRGHEWIHKSREEEGRATSGYRMGNKWVEKSQ